MADDKEVRLVPPAAEQRGEPEISHRHEITAPEAIAEAELPVAPDDRPAAAPGEQRFLSIIAVSAGAVIGAEARYLIGVQVARHWPGDFPWGTLLINVTGSLIIGFFLTLITERISEPPFVRLFLATGLLGAYTTFSTFSVETVTLMQHGHVTLAGIYVAASLLCGYGAARGGRAVARRSFA